MEDGIAVEGVFVAKDFLQVFCKKTIRITIEGLPPILNTVHFEKRLSTIDPVTAKKITEAMQALRRYAQVG